VPVVDLVAFAGNAPVAGNLDAEMTDDDELLADESMNADPDQPLRIVAEAARRAALPIMQTNDRSNRPNYAGAD